jgi:hypothetical protein
MKLALIVQAAFGHQDVQMEVHLQVFAVGMQDHHHPRLTSDDLAQGRIRRFVQQRATFNMLLKIDPSLSRYREGYMAMTDIPQSAH